MKNSTTKKFIFRIAGCVWLMLIPCIAGARLIGDSSVAILPRYVTFADSCIQQLDLERAKMWLDAAEEFVKKVDNPESLGFYYRILGNFYHAKGNDPEAYKNYYRAIAYYEKSESREKISTVYCNLASLYFHKQDAGGVGRIISEMKLNASKHESARSRLDLNEITALYYYCLYERDNNKNRLDSVVFYETRAVSDLETNENLRDNKSEVAFTYIMLALSMAKSEKYDTDSADRYLEKAKPLIDRRDTAMIINQLLVEGEIAFRGSQKTGWGEDRFIQLLTLLDSWSGTGKFSIYLDVYRRLSEIKERKNDPATALDYKNTQIVWMNKIKEEENAIGEAREKYVTEKKDEEIAKIHRREKIGWSYWAVCTAGLFIFLFIGYRLLSRKKRVESQLLLTQKEEEEMEGQDVLKSGIEDPNFRAIAADIYAQIQKRITDLNKKSDYFEALQGLTDRFFLNLRNIFQKDLTPIRVKYCICFAIGMSGRDIAKCFCIELRSVHMARHRLKSKELKLEKDVDLDLFLKQLNQ